MKRLAAPPRASSCSAGVLPSPPASPPSDDALSLVPPDAAAVGMIRVADLRTSPLFDRVFAETDRISGDADAARFLEEVRLNPKQDVDLVVFAGSPKAAGHRRRERFRRLRRAIRRGEARGRNRGPRRREEERPGGDYYLLPGPPPRGRDAATAAPWRSCRTG